jgi:hypothetical protein
VKDHSVDRRSLVAPDRAKDRVELRKNSVGKLRPELERSIRSVARPRVADLELEPAAALRCRVFTDQRVPCMNRHRQRKNQQQSRTMAHDTGS